MSFIHFGCWNNGLCDLTKRDSNGMSSVLNFLINDDTLDCDFYIVAGDNYYPKTIPLNTDESKSKNNKTDNNKNKKKKNKQLNTNDLHSGMLCIHELSKKHPVYMLMGNHDVKYEHALYEDNTKIDKCSIIKQQVEWSNVFHFNDYFKFVNENTICLFMNSMLYTSDYNEIYDCMKMYRPGIYANANGISDIRKIDETILTQLLKLFIRFKKNITNVIICAHDPILTYRIKNKNESPIQKREPLLSNGLHFLNTLYNIIPKANKYYLCADTHQYQKADIILGEHNITQYVVGTGGADCDMDNIQPDDDFKNIPITNTNDDQLHLQYKLLETKKSFGFLHCTTNIDNDELVFKFIDVKSCESKVKGRAKTKRNKKIKSKTKTKRKYRKR